MSTRDNLHMYSAWEYSALSISEVRLYCELQEFAPMSLETIVMISTSEERSDLLTNLSHRLLPTRLIMREWMAV